MRSEGRSIWELYALSSLEAAGAATAMGLVPRMERHEL